LAATLIQCHTRAGEGNENITVGYFNYIFDRAASGYRRIQNDFLICLPGTAPGDVIHLRLSAMPPSWQSPLIPVKLFLRLGGSVPLSLSSRPT
jgi:hypothetical protein